MIQVGDKFKDELKEWTVSEVYRGAALAFSGNITREFSKQYIYTIMYLEQKQRADELEKRWKKLKEHFVKEKEQSFGMLSWSRNNGALELMERLEEDDNA